MGGLDGHIWTCGYDVNKLEDWEVSLTLPAKYLLNRFIGSGVDDNYFYLKLSTPATMSINGAEPFEQIFVP